MAREPLGPGPAKKYPTPEEFDAAVDAYVQECKDEGKPVTWTGLALGMGFGGRFNIDQYAHYPGFEHSVQRARTIVEHNYELRLHSGSPTGAIFALKNMGWRDDRAMDMTSSDGSMAAPTRIVVAPLGSEDEAEGDDGEG